MKLKSIFVPAIVMCVAAFTATATPNYYQCWIGGSGSGVSCSNQGNGHYTVSWNTSNDWVAGSGWNPCNSQNIQWTGGCSGCNYFGVYGWFSSPLIEYYIGRGGGTSAGSYSTSKGTYTLNSYNCNGPNIQGNGAFVQYNCSGSGSSPINLAEHFQGWQSLGKSLNTQNYCIVASEAWSGSGSADVTVSEASGSNPTTPPTAVPTIAPTAGPTNPPTAAPTVGPTTPPSQNPIFSGGPYTLTGSSSSYVDLPDGLTNNLGDISIACWVKLNSLDTWSRIFDFGGDTNVFMMLTPASGDTGYPYFCITTSGNSGEQGINGTSALPTGSWQHIAVVKSGTTGILYINAREVGRNTGITLNPSDLGNTTNNYIGRSQWSNDPYLNASVDGFVVYNRALSTSEVTSLGSTPPGGGTKGDVNGNGAIDIVDALMIAQYFVGLNPENFNSSAADVNCSGGIDIVDALLIAQLYVGLISSFPC
jgi:endo-1,4-beta-xylanase